MNKDICPMMSSSEHYIDCTESCAWFDTEEKECAVTIKRKHKKS